MAYFTVVGSSILFRFHIFMEFIHEIISTVILANHSCLLNRRLYKRPTRHVSYLFEQIRILIFALNTNKQWERSGSVVECLTRDQRAAGSSLTASLRCVLEQEH